MFWEDLKDTRDFLNIAALLIGSAEGSAYSKNACSYFVYIKHDNSPRGIQKIHSLRIRTQKVKLHHLIIIPKDSVRTELSLNTSLIFEDKSLSPS